MYQKLFVSSALFLSAISFADTNRLPCDFTFDEVRDSVEPNNNFMVVVKRDDQGVAIRFKQVLPMNLNARDQLRRLTDDKKPVCLQATRLEDFYYVYNAAANVE